MSVTLANSCVTATISEVGAEIKRLKELATGTEYIWQGDAAYWTGSAPILFPIVGGLKGGKYHLGGATYYMPQHGFVRKKPWSEAGSDGTTAAFRTESDDATRSMYPFEFVLTARFRVEGKGLVVQYEVVNSGEDVMYFSIGSHPAFNVPFAGGHLENYYYHFSESEKLQRYFFQDGMHLNETEEIFNNSRQIFLTPTIFDRGPIILKHPVSKDVYLMNSRNAKRIRLATDGMAFLGLWSKPNAPLACIEPWYGIPDNIDTDQEFTTKEGIMTLEGGGTYTTSYRIDIMDGPEIQPPDGGAEN